MNAEKKSSHKEKKQGAWALKKLEGQRLFLSLSLFSLILVAVFANEQMMRQERPHYVTTNMQGPDRLDALNRAIASAQPVNVFRDLEWEHQLAQRLGKEKTDRQPASVSQKVTLMDDLRYGPLAGKYRIRSIQSVDDTKVTEIEYIDSAEITDQPIHLSDAQAFLMKYRSLMKVDYAQAKLAYQADGKQSWQLIGQDQQLVGRAEMKYDSEGHFLGLAIQTAE